MIENLENSMGVLSDIIRTYHSNLDDPHTLVKLQQYLPEYIHLTEEYNQLVEQRNSIVTILRSTRGRRNDRNRWGPGGGYAFYY